MPPTQHRRLLSVLRAGLIAGFVTWACAVRPDATGPANNEENPEIVTADPDTGLDDPANLTAPWKPRRVLDLAVVSMTNSSATLRFTEVDDGTGNPASYDVRYAFAPISWGAASSASQGTCALPVAGIAIGAERTCTVDGLVAGRTYNFQLVAFRGTRPEAIFGRLSNIAAGTTSTTAPARPASVTDLRVSSVDLSTVTLAFTEVDDGTGNPATYDVRYALSPITWGPAPSASQGTCALPVAGTVVGAPRSCTVAGLQNDQNYDFQLVAFRGTLNTPEASFGQLSNIVSARTGAGVPAPVASVTVSPAAATLSAGQTRQLSVTLSDSGGNPLTGRTITWATSNAPVVSVGSSGLVTALSVGAATITATSEGVSGTSAITTSAARLDLQITNVATPTNPVVGDTVLYTLVVRNNGPAGATDVVGGDTLPAGVTYHSHTANAGVFSSTSGVWAIGNLSANGADTLRIKATVNSGTGGLTILNRAAVRTNSLTLVDTLAGNNSATATVVVQASSPPPPPPPPPPSSAGEPTFSAGVDAMIYEDNFDAYATPDERHARLQYLRSTQGSNHATFLSDNRGVDYPAASFYELHQIATPGRNGSAHALRSRYLDNPNNQSSTWVTWPTGNRKYSPDTAVVVMQVHIKVNSIGWDVNSPGWKFFEWWVPGGTNRTQVSLSGPPGGELFHVNPNGTGNFCFQPSGTTRWQNINDGQWHRLTFVYRAASAAGSTTGIVRLYVDGAKVIDCSSTGMSDGFATLSDVQRITTDPASFLKFPDVLNTNSGRGIASMDYDDIAWWVEKGS